MTAGVDFPTLGWEVLEWIEAYLCHGPGDVQGQPLELDDELARFVLHAYRLDEATGRRVYRRAFLSRPKGRAKSELAAAIAVAEALGPVRFDGWNAAGDPVGRPVTAPYVRILATEEGQTGNTYDHVRVMLAHGIEHHPDTFAGVDPGLTRALVPDGIIIPSTASSSAKDGGRESFAVADETHLYTLPELRRMHATVSRNLAKRKAAEPWLLETSTMYAIGEESIAELLHRAHLRGGPAMAGILFDHRQAPAHVDLRDDEALLAALRDLYGPSAAWMDLERILVEIRDPTTTEADARRYWLNQPVTAEEAWMPPAAWSAIARPDVEVEPDEAIAVGFDGSQSDDATALVACRLADGFLWPLGIWEPGPGDDVPRVEVDQAVEAAFERYNVVRLYADPPYWQDNVDRWRAAYGEKVVLEWWTNRERAMVAAVERLHTAAVTGVASHNGDALLAAHVTNARRRATRSGTTIRKDRPGSPRKIDAAIAAILAYEARSDALAAGLGRPRRRRKVASF